MAYGSLVHVHPRLRIVALADEPVGLGAYMRASDSLYRLADETGGLLPPDLLRKAALEHFGSKPRT